MSGYRVDPSVGEGIAPQYPPCRQQAALKGAVFFYGFQPVLRTGWNIRTSCPFHRRYIFLIELYHLNKQLFHVYALPVPVKAFQNVMLFGQMKERVLHLPKSDALRQRPCDNDNIQTGHGA